MSVGQRVGLAPAFKQVGALGNRLKAHPSLHTTHSADVFTSSQRPTCEACVRPRRHLIAAESGHVVIIDTVVPRDALARVDCCRSPRGCDTVLWAGRALVEAPSAGIPVEAQVARHAEGARRAERQVAEVARPGRKRGCSVV